MKVLMVSNMYPSYPRPDFGKVVYQLTAELQRQGCDLRVIAPIPLNPFAVRNIGGFIRTMRDYSPVPTHMMWDSTEVYYPRYLLPPVASFEGRMSRAFNSIKGLVDRIYQDFGFDVVHGQMALPNGFTAMLIAHRYNKPLVTTTQGGDVDINIYKSRQHFDAVSRTLANSDYVISPSSHVRDKLLDRMNLISTLIPYGIYADEIYSGESELGHKYEGKTVLLSASRLVGYKGIQLNMAAVAKLRGKYPSLHYLVIGGGDEKDYLIGLSRYLGIQDSVEFLGYLPHDKVLEYMSICDIFSLPSWRETFGLVYLEAMAHGKPIVCCHDQAVDGLIMDGATGFTVEPKELDSLVAMLDALLANPEKCNEVGEKAKRLVLEHYTWDKIAERHIAVYEKVLK